MLQQNNYNRSERIAVLGYGSQGKAQALNLRDSGREVVVGLRPGGKSWNAALADGFQPMPMEDSVKWADTVAFLLPDMVHARVFNALRSHFKDGQMLLFAHGFSVHYDLFELPENVDVSLVAPNDPPARHADQGTHRNDLPYLRYASIARSDRGSKESNDGLSYLPVQFVCEEFFHHNCVYLRHEMSLYSTKNILHQNKDIASL